MFKFPDELLAGRTHSDGCRVINRVKKYEYPRYMFTNYSAAIRSLLARTCGLVAVDCGPAGPINMSVARRHGVEILELVGPKR